MRIATILCLALVLAPGALLAQGPDTIGLWFDQDYTINAMPVPIGQAFDGYLVLHEASADAVAAAAFAFGFDSDFLFLLDSQWHGDPEVLVVGDCTHLFYGTPLPTGPATLLNTFTFLAVADDIVFFHVLACQGEACASYSPPGQDPVCLSTVFPDGVVACLGCEVGAEATSWTGVKSLYR